MPRNPVQQTAARFILLNGLVGVSYFSLGSMCLQLAVYPSQAAAVWPSAGVALAAILLCGPRILPGVFLGNFFVSAWAFAFDPACFIAYLSAGTGATLCAYLAYHLIRYSIGVPNELVCDRDTIQFLILGGPVSCLISATLGIGGMYLAGIIQLPDLAFNWFSWWAGDSIGVFIFTPLLLTLFYRFSPVWKRRRLILTLPVLVTFFLVIVLFIYIQKLENRRQQAQLVYQANIISRTIESRLQTHIRNIEAIHHFINSHNGIDKHEFSLFTRPILAKFAEIKSIRWLSYNGDYQLIRQFKEKKPDFLTNFMSFPSYLRSQFYALALQSFGGSVYLHHYYDVLNLFIPVKADKSTQKYEAFGLIALTVDIRELLEPGLKNRLNTGVDVTIRDASSGQVIYTDTRQYGGPDPAENENRITIGNLEWILRFSHRLLADNEVQWTLWWVIFSGLLFTSLLGVGLLLLTGRYFKTERVVKARSDELLAAKNHAETANQAKSRFVSKISHELRAPLNGILGFSQLLQQRNNLSHEDRHKINIIDQCGKHLLNLINDLLDIASIESNKLTLHNGPFELNPFINNIVAMFRLRTDANNLQLIVKKRYRHLTVVADENRLRQVLVNLLANAIKFTPQGSITLTVDYAAKHLTMIVKDTGCGISRANQQAIFSPFVQIDVAKVERDGIGLGLAITQELVRLMHGTIKLDSELGRGSTFTVTVPVTVTHEQTQTALAPDDPDESSSIAVKLLIAEDNEINLLLLSHMLNELNCNYDIAANGTQAWHMLQTKHYQMALIDLNMPEMSGYQLIAKIRQQALSLTAVAMSAYADQANINNALKAGFDHYLTKPIDSSTLKQLIANKNVAYE